MKIYNLNFIEIAQMKNFKCCWFLKTLTVNLVKIVMIVVVIKLDDL